MELNHKTAVQLSLVQVVMLGIKRHFRAARCGEPRMGRTSAHFEVTVLGITYRITIRELK